jgi:hypothetical protein
MRAILQHLAEQSSDFVGSLYNRLDLIPHEQRAAAIVRARERFKAQPAGFVGSLCNLADPPPPGIRRAEVVRSCSRSFTVGPIAFGISLGGFARIDLASIYAKLSREDYRGDTRLELLACERWGRLRQP